MRHVNQFIHKQKFKYDDWRKALSYINQSSGFLFRFDLSQAFHHVDMHKNDQTYLGFVWDINGIRKWFSFTVLPFGLTTGPWVLTKVLKPLVNHWRRNGICICLYLDDGWGYNSSHSVCLSHSKQVKCDLLQSGFIINCDKSQWEPVTVLDWIGLTWNLRKGVLTIPDHRVTKMNNICVYIMHHVQNISARKMAQLAGNIISMFPVLGNVTRLMSRNMYEIINSRVSWDYGMNVASHSGLLNELKFWNSNIDSLNYSKLIKYQKTHKIVYSNASQVALGAYVLSCGNIVSHKNWSSVERQKSSTWRELSALTYSLQAFLQVLSGQNVKWFTDSQNVVTIVNNGSKVPELQNLALSIYKWCIQDHIQLEVDWVPRTATNLEKADFLSRIIDYDDWAVTRSFFHKIDTIWGPHTVDRFANDQNTKLPRFNSRFWNPLSETVDSFTIEWTGENNWLVPPIHLIPRVLHHLQASQACGTLIVPKWQSSSFWPILFPNGYEHKNHIVDEVKNKHIKQIYEFESCNVFQHGNNNNSIFGSKDFKSKVLAVRLDYS